MNGGGVLLPVERDNQIIILELADRGLTFGRGKFYGKFGCTSSLFGLAPPKTAYHKLEEVGWNIATLALYSRVHKSDAV